MSQGASAPFVGRATERMAACEVRLRVRMLLAGGKYEQLAADATIIEDSSEQTWLGRDKGASTSLGLHIRTTARYRPASVDRRRPTDCVAQTREE
jgi:hypothetical protein